MPDFRHLSTATALVAALALASTATAIASTPPEKQAARQDERAAGDRAPFQTAPGVTAQSMAAADDQHGGSGGHLPATASNLELVGKLEVTKRFGDVLPGQIADLAVFDDHAYLNSWNEASCTRGGVYVADINRPSRPEEVAFIPALPGNYHGEGAQVKTVRTHAFRGDLLAVNNELCDDNASRGGGFDLYDVSNPRKPRILVQGFGDFGGEGTQSGASTISNQYHSVFFWQDGKKGRVYLVGVDNLEAHDVDIYDITNPRTPVPIGEHDLVEEFPQIVDGSANGDNIFLHDMVVKEINGVQTMLADYWDAGYVTLDVSDPTTLKYVGDTTFDGPDPLTGITPPEGNAHQGEFSADNRYILAADEDFNPYRAGKFSITSGPNAGEYHAQEVGGGTSVASLPDRRLNGPTVWGGYGCNASTPVPQRSSVALTLDPGEEAILVLERGPANDPGNAEGACFPGEKAANAAAAGWDAVLLVNRHAGSAEADGAFCGSGGYPEGAHIVTLCTTHAAFHRLFGTEPRFETPYAPGDAPAAGTVGEKVEGTSVFDGWGYAHLYRNEPGKMTQIDAFAIPESLDPAYAFGYGDLSIHEFATDPRRNLAYSSYYAGGARVLAFGESGLQEVGRFIDEGGNNFWGVEYVGDQRGGRQDSGDRSGDDGGKGRPLIALSDRDYGLYLLRYTGPGSGR